MREEGSQLNWKLKPHHRLTEDQFNRILAASIGSFRDWMLIYLTGNTGLRICEILHLQLSDFDPDAGVRVIRRKKRTLEQDILHLPDEVFRNVEQYALKENISSWVFPGATRGCRRTIAIRDKKNRKRKAKSWKVEKLCNGGHLSIRRAQQIWDFTLMAVGLKVPGRGIHTLRHFDGTRYYAKTKDIRATQIRLGHSSLEVTQIYVDVVEQREKAQEVGAAGGRGPWEKEE